MVGTLRHTALLRMHRRTAHLSRRRASLVLTLALAMAARTRRLLDRPAEDPASQEDRRERQASLAQIHMARLPRSRAALLAKGMAILLDLTVRLDGEKTRTFSGQTVTICPDHWSDTVLYQ